MLTGVSDVEAPAGRGVVGLELQADYVPAAGQLGGDLVTREGAQDGDIRNAVIFDRKEIKLRFHVEIVKDEVNSASWFRNDQPDTVHVVAVLLGVIGRENNSGRRGEVEEAGNCEDTDTCSYHFAHGQTAGHVALTDGSLL